MNTIRGKLYFVYILIFIAIIATVFSSYIAVDTFDQHVMLTELLSRQRQSVETVISKVSVLAQVKSLDNEVYTEISKEEIESINYYKQELDEVLEVFISRQYLYNGNLEELIYETNESVNKLNNVFNHKNQQILIGAHSNRKRYNKNWKWGERPAQF